MGIKDRMLEGVTGKAIKGLKPFMESIHARLELQNALMEELIRITYKTTLSWMDEEVNERIKQIKDQI